MKLFLVNSMKFLGILILISISFYAGIAFMNSKKSNDYLRSIDKKKVFIGDSHMQCAINDALITKSINFSQNSESYYFTYYKLKKIIALNKQVKTVCLGFSYHNLSSYYDDYVFGKQNSEIFSRYFFILPASEQVKSFTYNFNNEMLYFKNILAKGILNILEKQQQYSFLGWYQNNFSNVESNKSSMGKRIKFQFFHDKKTVLFSEINILYLNKIIALCKENNVALVVMNTPLDPYYKSKIPQKYIDKYNQIIANHKLKVIDFHTLKFQKNDFIKDGDHVSRKGSLLISNFLNNSF